MSPSSSTPSSTGAVGTSSAPPQIGLALATVFLMYLGQMSLNPIIAPLSREIGLAEWQVGVMVSVAALTIVVTSQFWGRRSLSWGRKPVLLAAMATGTAAMAIFALLAQLGMAGLLQGVPLFIAIVLARGLLFGLAVSAVPPTVQAYIADVTPTEAARVKGMAGVGAVQGVAMVAGAVAGGLLAGFGMLVPLLFVPAVLLIGLVLVFFRLRPEQSHLLIPNPPRVSPFDTRVWPFLLAGFGMFTALGFIQIITGFIIQDRFALDASTTALVTGGSLVAAGIGMVLAQIVIVPRSGWSPVRLLRVGAIVALLGFVLLVPDWGMAVLVASVFLVGLGLGIAMPGYTAAPSLLMAPAEQGGLAGLIGANNALTFVVAPTLATALYGLWPLLPVLVSVGIMLVLLVFLGVHPRFRMLAAVVETEPESAAGALPGA